MLSLYMSFLPELKKMFVNFLHSPWYNIFRFVVMLISHLCSSTFRSMPLANGFIRWVWADKEVKLKRTRHPSKSFVCIPNQIMLMFILFVWHEQRLHGKCFHFWKMFPLCVCTVTWASSSNGWLFGAKTKSKSCARNIYIFVFSTISYVSISTLALVVRSFVAQRLKCVNIQIVHTVHAVRVCVICIQLYIYVNVNVCIHIYIYLDIYFYWISSNILGRCVNVCVRLLSIVASVPVVLLFFGCMYSFTL